MILARLNERTEAEYINGEKTDGILRHQLKSRDTSEAAYQTIESSLITASSCNRDNHQITHALLSECQRQLLQIRKDRDPFDLTGTRCSSLLSNFSRNPSITRANQAATWKLSSYRLPIGTLRIHLYQVQQAEKSRSMALKVSRKSRLEVQFVPPRWLSGLMISYSLETTYHIHSQSWRWGATLHCMTVNRDPHFEKAVAEFDYDAVVACFASGRAKLSDHMVVRTPWSHHAIHWSCVSHQFKCEQDVLITSQYLLKSARPVSPCQLCPMSDLIFSEDLPGW